MTQQNHQRESCGNEMRAQQTVDDLLLDGIHPNADGHRLIAELLLKQLTK